MDEELLGWSRVLVIVARFVVCGGGQLAGRAQLWRHLVDREVCWDVFVVDLPQLCSVIRRRRNGSASV